MNKIITGADLSEKEKSTIFWASFLSLAAAGVSLAFRIAMGGVYGSELGLTNLQIGQIVGAQFWPVAITMIGFSLVVDRTGYKAPMFAAAALQIIGGLGTFFIKQIMDDAVFKKDQQQWVNHLILSKKI